MEKLNESKTKITTDERGSWQYPSMAAQGMVEVELPSLPGSPHPTERLHARDFGRHVIGKIESAMKRSPYIRTGAVQSPAEVLEHYSATAKGSQLMPPDVISNMERLAKEFRAEPEKGRQNYFETMVAPFLSGLQPQRRDR
jgi:hypothetical protein